MVTYQNVNRPGLHPKGIRAAFCWSRNETKKRLAGIASEGSIERYLAHSSSKRYFNPSKWVLREVYNLYQQLLAAGEKPLNEEAISKWIVST
jgi:hypothetical protein